MGESWFELPRCRVHDCWVALIASLKSHWNDWEDLDEKLPGVGGREYVAPRKANLPTTRHAQLTSISAGHSGGPYWT